MSNSQQLPEPDPALKRLNVLVGIWNFKGRTLDSEADNVFIQATYEWLPGGFFLKSNFKADFVGLEIQGLEIIGYDPSSDTFPSTVYTNSFGEPIHYRYDIKGNDIIITTDFAGGGKNTGKISEDGNTFSAGWRPEPGKEGSINVAYDYVGTREK